MKMRRSRLIRAPVRRGRVVGFSANAAPNIRERRMLDDLLLADYARTFFGYGNYRGDWWLIGMEEGGGDSEQSVAERLRLWSERGRRPLEDVAMFNTSPEHGKWFTRRPPLQPTWRGLVRLILAAEGRATDADTARAYQGSELGRTGSNNCLLELLPLPSPTVGDWIYGSISTLPELTTRELYAAAFVPSRIDQLRQRVAEHRPRAVIFYSRAYRAQWEQIAGQRFLPTNVENLELCRAGDTVFALTPHPVYRGITTDFFVRAGAAIGGICRSREG